MVGVQYAEMFKVMVLFRSNEEHRDKDLQRAEEAEKEEA
jgi:hypothetical protein